MNEQHSSLRQYLTKNEQFFFRPFSEREIELFCRYFGLVLKWNPQLHLTTIISPQEFAERHLLESAFAAQKLANFICEIWDIGSGAGIPGVPMAILRPDLPVILVESNKKKAIFLKEVKSELDLENLKILNQRFESIKAIGQTASITTRAIDSMSRIIPQILKLGYPAAQMLFLGGYTLHDHLQMYSHSEWSLSTSLIPYTENRLVISLTRFT